MTERPDLACLLFRVVCGDGLEPPTPALYMQQLSKEKSVTRISRRPDRSM